MEIKNMTNYKITYKIADYYGQPESLWKGKPETITIDIAGNPVYEAEYAIRQKLGKTPNWGIEILSILENNLK